MNKNAITGILAVGILAAGGSALLLGGLVGKEGELTDGGIIAQPVFETPTEAQLVDKSVRSTSGRAVRVAGVSVEKEASVTDSEIGRTVEVASIPPEAICNVLVETEPRDGGIDLPREITSFGSQPVKVGDKLYMILVKGDSCKAIGDFHGYLGSTMQEFLALPMEKQKMFLKVMGLCQVDGGMMDCVVPVGDKRAKEDAKPFFPAQWAGREDLGFGQMEVENSL